MKTGIEYRQFDELGPEVLKFWRERVKEMDPINVLTRSPEWYAMMAEGRDGALISAARDADGKIIGVVPMIPVDAPWSGRKMMKVVGGELTAAGAMSGAELAGWLKDVSERGVVYFDHLSNAQLKAMDEAGGMGGVVVVPLLSRLPHYRFRLPPSIDSVKNVHSSRTRQKVKAAERKLANISGAVKMMDISSYDQLKCYKGALEAMMNSTWQARKLGHSFAVESMKAVADKKWLRCFMLFCGEKVIAFAGCYQGMGTLVYEIVGYDQAYREYSPGKLLLHKMVERLYEGGGGDRPEYVDFGEGEGLYKGSFANDRIDTNAAFIAARGSPESFGLRLYCMKKRLRAAISRWIKHVIH